MDPKPSHITDTDEQTNAIALAEFPEDQTQLAVAGHKAGGINIGGNTVTQATDEMPEEARTILRALHTHARERRWSPSELQRNVGLSWNLLYQVWTGRYRYPAVIREKHCLKCGKKNIATNRAGGHDDPNCGGSNRDVQILEKPHPQAGQLRPLGKETMDSLRRWKVRLDQAVKQMGDFVETSVWRRIEAVYKRAFKSKKMFFVFGRSQIGKTTCGKELARVYNTGQTTYVDMPPGAGAQYMLKCIAKALHVNSDTNFQNLLDDVCDALDPSKALILDNMHRVFTTYQKGSVMRCMDTLLYIYDSTHCVMGIFATNIFADALEEGQFFRYLEQFKRRGVYIVRLEDEPTREDLDLVCARYGLEPARGEAEAIMEHIAHKDGLGAICTRIQDACDLAEKQNRAVTWADFIKANTIAEKLARKPEARKKK